MELRPLNDEELHIIDLLTEADALFRKLPPANPCDGQDFVHALNAAANIILARPGSEAYPERK